MASPHVRREARFLREKTRRDIISLLPARPAGESGSHAADLESRLDSIARSGRRSCEALGYASRLNVSLLSHVQKNLADECEAMISARRIPY